MAIPLQLTFHNVQSSASVEEKIRENVQKLERFYNRVINCRVTVDAPHRNQRKGNLYHVRIDLTLPKENIIVNHNPSDETSHADIYIAIRDAFETARRQLQDYTNLHQ
ncbi:MULTISPECIES: HPF/RaiA family ribosome-associated protein [Nostocales]|uniref:RNA polymerase subunit sigma-54 n=3 Tax=Nostocales TaxID=1161 RepID=A0A0C1NAT5_9CYAN|nr:HPF/RaiA family ribosome-associated protein [Tolypothrix bouteillei]KAF3884646.1 ribosome-associated translation inhibitor RaiA [Tolypothrix bouteillei VB521301]